MYLLHNFHHIQEQEFHLSYQSRGFQYNDGCFDTLIWQNGKVRFLADHLERIKQAMYVLNLQAHPQLNNPEYVTNQISELIKKNNLPDEIIRVKINIWREAGGLFTPASDKSETLISIQPQNNIPEIINQADFCEVIFNHFTPLSFFKGPYAAHYVLASIAKKKAGLDEMILLDDKGYVSEALVSNIFWIKNNELFTPALECGCIAGIMRLNILRTYQMLKIPVWEGLFPKADLLNADSVFTSNVTGLRPIKHIQDKSFSTSHPFISQLQSLVLAHADIA